MNIQIEEISRAKYVVKGMELPCPLKHAALPALTSTSSQLGSSPNSVFLDFYGGFTAYA